MLDIVARQGAQHVLDPAARAATAGPERQRREDPDTILVEQTVEQVVGRQRRVGELGAGGAGHQRQRPAPAIVGGLELALLAIVVEAFARQALQHQHAGAPAAIAGDRQLDAGLELLGLAEVMMDAFDQGGAGQLDDALVALGMLALVDREGEVAGAEQARHREAGAGAGGQRRQPRGVELGIAAHVAAAGDVGDHQPDRPVALGLQGEDAVELERAGQRRGERQHLGQQLGDRLGIVMLRQHRIDQRPEPDQPAARAAALDLERLHLVGRGLPDDAHRFRTRRGTS